MNFIEILILSIALSIDACVVSFSYGLCTLTQKRLTSLQLAITTGFFQAFMPVLGYYFTNSINSFIQPYAKGIVFIIFAHLGISFIKEAFEEKNNNKTAINLKTLFLIGIATSIDAFSAGITLYLTSSRLLLSILTIGGVTFINSVIGFSGGYCLKKFSPKILEITAGLLLIALAINSLF